MLPDPPRGVVFACLYCPLQPPGKEPPHRKIFSYAYDMYNFFLRDLYVMFFDVTTILHKVTRKTPDGEQHRL